MTGKRLVTKERMSDYGSPAENFEAIAMMWSALFNTEVTPEQVALAMICLKVVRENRKHKDDNLDDIEGYVEIVRMLK